MRVDLHGAVSDCQRIHDPHSRAQVQMVLLSLAEDCSGCEHFKAFSSCIGCDQAARVNEVKTKILSLIGRQVS